MKKNICKVMLFWVVLIGLVLSLPMKAEALEPKLLWKKEFKCALFSKLAKGSGDVIVNCGRPNISLFDKLGNTIFAWGPRVDRVAYSPDISDDGSRVILTSSWRNNYVLRMKKDSIDERVHYLTRKGKELWNGLYPPPGYLELVYQGFYRAYLSPDGNYVAIVGLFDVEGGGKNIELWDSTGKKLWTYDAPSVKEGIDDFIFSPDSKYLIAGTGGGSVIVLDLSGNVIFQDSHFTQMALSQPVASDNLNYIATTGVYRTVIRDRTGNIVLDLGKGNDRFVMVNRLGTRGVVWDATGVKVYSLPDKALVKQYDIGFTPEWLPEKKIDISRDGRYLTLWGKKTNLQTQASLFVIDLINDKVWETALSGFKLTAVALTWDGQYLLVEQTTDGKQGDLFFYQLY